VVGSKNRSGQPNQLREVAMIGDLVQHCFKQNPPLQLGFKLRPLL